MSSPGINPLAIIAPDLYAKQLAIQRRQALAQSLMEQGQAPTGAAAYGGLRNAGNAILGAILAKRGDQDMANLYAPPPEQQAPQAPAQQPSLSQQDVPEPQISNNPGSGPTMAAPNAAMGQALQNKPPQAAPAAAQQPRTIPQAMGGMIPDLPGMTHQQSMLEYFQDPQDYWKALAPTTEYRNALTAAGGDPQMAQQYLVQAQAKTGAINTTRGMTQIPDGQGGYRTVYAPPPAPAGYQYQPGQDGGLQLVEVQRGQQAVAGSALAAQVPKALTTPAIGYGADSQPVASNALAMSGNANLAPQLGIGPMIPGVNPGATQAVESRGNPGAVSPAGAAGPMQVMPGTQAQPGFGVQPAQPGVPGEQGRVGADYQQAMMQRYQNPVLATIAYNWGPGNTDKWLAAGADFSKLPPETQQYLGRIAVAQAIPQRGSQGAPSPSQPQQAGAAPRTPLLPELPKGQPEYMQAQGKDAADRHDATVAAAQNSKFRAGILDNILDLSQAGVKTGPTQAWQNQALGTLANLPGVSALPGMATAKDNISRFQILQKFLLNQGQQAWQAAGGTQTDAQLEAFAHANPNDAQFPAALQAVTKWFKAGELAVQAKANAQDEYLSKNGQTPTSQIKFENVWRNAYDPKVFQLENMSPQEQQQYVKGLPAATAKTLLQKRQQLRSLGAIQ